MNPAVWINKANQKCHLEHKSSTTLPSGTRSTTWLRYATSVSCWVQQSGEAQVSHSAQVGYRVTHRVYFAADPELAEGDRIVHGSIRLIVQAVNNVASKGLLWQADCTEMR